MQDVIQLEKKFSEKKFLIIDDFQGMRGLLRDVLRGCGTNPKYIAMAANGREALSILEHEKIDVVLCDFNLGSGKNGQHVLEEAKFRQLIGPTCAWIMITAEKTPEIVAGAAEFQPDTYLIKPITEAALRSRLARIWARKDAFSKIAEALSRGNREQAVRLCDEKMAADKTNATELQRFKCQLLLDSGNIELARKSYAEVLAIRETPWAKVGIAKVHYQTGQYEDAKKLLEEVIRDNTAFLEAYDWLAKTLQLMGEINSAEQILERAARLSPNSITRQKTLGEIAFKLGKHDDAERAFRKSVTLGEHSVLKTPDAYIGLAKACSAKQNPDDALEVLKNLNSTFDSEEIHLKSLAVAGQVYHQSGNQQKANDAARELKERMAASGIRPNSETTVEMARLMFATGESNHAVTLLQEAVRNNPDNAGLLVDVQAVFDAANMREEGQRLVSASRKEVIEMMNKGVLLMRDGKLTEAVVWMRDAHQAMPKNVRVLFNFLQVLMTQIQQRGIHAELAAEARAGLHLASQLAPADLRIVQMTEILDKLSP